MSDRTYWKPHTASLGRFVLAATRAVTGEWGYEGQVKRFWLHRSKTGRSLHLIVGPWCLTAAISNPR